MIGLGCDSAGYELKMIVIDYLKENGYEYKDFGCEENDKGVDYNDYADKVAEAVLSKECERGILICGTGIGISIAANKHKGIRAALCSDVYSAKSTRLHNDANILAMGGRVIGQGPCIEILEAFLKTPFSNVDRHKRRVDKLNN